MLVDRTYKIEKSIESLVADRDRLPLTSARADSPDEDRLRKRLRADVDARFASL